ncbi:GGDEF domain-containing protein [Sphingopyxis sp. DHUNG17]|uniref:GGDEF domain-containing protein n=1 Tax=Sphingopyxis TaxID=165697 RepID=UPI00191E27EE|nr:MULTISPECIES: GGDEF domain-containing protein [Sphingopyxis]MBL0767288.1 GGDEF domain-containing protein [Sphingopyxis lutea]
MFAPRSITVFKGISRLAYSTLRISRLQAWALVALLTAFAAVGDLVSGKDIWFGPVYLFVLCVATWLLGWAVGHGVGIFCMILTFIINGASLYPYATSAFSLDLVMRFVAMSIILSAIAAVRGAYMREWWLARIDSMTGALNRQAFFEFGELMCDVGSWRVMLFADLDGFKAINDGEGHAVGDQCLKDFARSIRASIRKADIFARMGGDEFVIFMSVKGKATGPAVAERLHRVMNSVPSPAQRDLRSSVGALIIPPGRASLDDLVRQADDLMYSAKAIGAGLRIGDAHTTASTTSKARARAAPRPTILFDAPTPSFTYERRASPLP